MWLVQIGNKLRCKKHKLWKYYFLKCVYNLLYFLDSTDTENKFVVTKGEKEVGRDKIGVWDYQIQTIMYKIHK